MECMEEWDLEERDLEERATWVFFIMINVTNVQQYHIIEKFYTELLFPFLVEHGLVRNCNQDYLQRTVLYPQHL